MRSGILYIACALAWCICNVDVVALKTKPYVLFDRLWIQESVGTAPYTVHELQEGICRSGAPPLPLASASIDSIHEALRSKSTSCERLIAAHFDRIDAYDTKLGINAVLSLRREDALAEAREMDRIANMKDGNTERNGEREVWPEHMSLFCIPFLIKDNIDVANMPTTAGNLGLTGNVAGRDAWAVERLKDAGAIILGKSSMAELALFASWSTNSLVGETRNPYHLSYTTAGSSSGSAAAVAAGFSAAALGTDTGSSVRGPAAFTATVGLRPSLGLIGRSGLLPLRWQHDTIGPITRNVRDAAMILDVLVAYDPHDNLTSIQNDYKIKVLKNSEENSSSSNRTNKSIEADIVPTYTDILDESSLEDSRIGILWEMANMPGNDPEVVGLFQDALNVLSSKGAVLNNFRIEGNKLGKDWDPNRTGRGPAVGHWSVSSQWLDLWSCFSPLREAFDQYMTRRNTEGIKPGNSSVYSTMWDDNACYAGRESKHESVNRISSLEDLYKSKKYHPMSEDTLLLSLYSVQEGQESLVSSSKSISCGCGTVESDVCRSEFRKNLIDTMDKSNIDVVIYPSWGRSPLLIGDRGDGYYDGNFSPMIAPHTGAPAITVPMGYTRGGLPAGLQFLARPGDEKTLLKIAYAYETETKHRVNPPLMKECIDDLGNYFLEKDTMGVAG